MKSKAKNLIIEHIKQNGPSKPSSLAQALGISAQALHRHLKKMVDDKVLLKRGESPIVFYDLLAVVASQDHDP